MKKILVDGGYYDYEKQEYFFYIQDHLGNNRVVVNQNDSVVQRSDYYPFGMEFADNSGNDQPYKYNGKELDKMHGLNMYDYSARYTHPAYGRFTSVDPLAEKYYSISPYVYCYNNPVKYIDPDGRSSVLTLPARAAKHGRNMYRAAKAFLFGSSTVAGANVYNHFLSQEQAQIAQDNFLNTVKERAAETESQEIVDEARASTPEGLADAKRRQSLSDAEDLKHVKTTEKITPNDKDPMEPKGGLKVIAYILLGAGATQELTNPDPSKDAHEAHKEKKSDSSKGKKSWIDFLEELLNYNNEKKE